LPWTNPDAADRVIESVHHSCKNLAIHPELGPVRRFPDNNPADIRFFPLTDFPDYLIFYRAKPEQVEIIRVLYGSRDINELFSS
jgi:toxin ParE1/3/4